MQPIVRIPGFPEFVRTEDQKFVRESFLDMIQSFAQTGQPAAEGSWPAFGPTSDQAKF
jgi:hypothetical protein